MSNHLEVCELPDGKIIFDHSTSRISAEWNNGHKETWNHRGYSYRQKLKSFYMLSDQWDKANEVVL